MNNVFYIVGVVVVVMLVLGFLDGWELIAVRKHNLISVATLRQN